MATTALAATLGFDLNLPHDVALSVTEEIIRVIQDTGVRMEVKEFLPDDSEMSMREIHDALDGLVKVLRGDEL